MIAREDIAGLILAGGRSRRMQGQDEQAVDKGLLILEGAPLVQWVGEHMKTRVDMIYISANRHLDAYRRYGCCVSDDPEFGEDAGPLAGVASVMAQARQPWLFVLPVDVPRVPPDLFSRLLEAVSGGAPLAYACAGRDAHPLCMMVRSDRYGDLRAYLLAGGRKVLDWHRRHNAVPVDFGDDASLFHNINTPDDWQAAGGGGSKLRC